VGPGPFAVGRRHHEHEIAVLILGHSLQARSAELVRFGADGCLQKAPRWPPLDMAPSAGVDEQDFLLVHVRQVEAVERFRAEVEDRVDFRVAEADHLEPAVFERSREGQIHLLNRHAQTCREPVKDLVIDAKRLRSLERRERGLVRGRFWVPFWAGSAGEFSGGAATGV